MLKKLKQFVIANKSVDSAWRYLPVVRFLKSLSLNNKSLLEIGSGDLGITPYLKKNIIGLDVFFESGSTELIKKIKYHGGKFPFTDNEFNISFSVDAYEHIPKEQRADWVQEIFRVTEDYFILVIPCGSDAYIQDKKLLKYFKKVHNKEDRFLKEHVENGVIYEKDVLKLFKDKEIIKNKQINNLHFRLFLMKLKINKNIVASIMYYLFLPLVYLPGLLDFGKTYRRIFIIKI